jgi:hypothetical protein
VVVTELGEVATGSKITKSPFQNHGKNNDFERGFLLFYCFLEEGLFVLLLSFQEEKEGVFLFSL